MTELATFLLVAFILSICVILLINTYIARLLAITALLSWISGSVILCIAINIVAFAKSYQLCINSQHSIIKCIHTSYESMSLGTLYIFLISSLLPSLTFFLLSIPGALYIWKSRANIDLNSIVIVLMIGEILILITSAMIAYLSDEALMPTVLFVLISSPAYVVPAFYFIFIIAKHKSYTRKVQM